MLNDSFKAVRKTSCYLLLNFQPGHPLGTPPGIAQQIYPAPALDGKFFPSPGVFEPHRSFHIFLSNFIIVFKKWMAHETLNILFAVNFISFTPKFILWLIFFNKHNSYDVILQVMCKKMFDNINEIIL